jgi:type IV pilus assembly protein PilE
MEVLITISIMALLAAVAYPSYQGQISKIRRTEAKQALLKVSQQLERCYTRYRRYNPPYPDDPDNSDNSDCRPADKPPIGPPITVTSDEGHYRISSISPSGVQSLAVESFTLYATPLGSQARDSQCAVLRYYSNSDRKAFDAAGNDTTSVCW